MKRALETQQKRDFLVIPDAHEIFFSLFFITIDLLRYPSMYYANNAGCFFDDF